MSIVNDSVFMIRSSIGDIQKSRWSDFVIIAKLNTAVQRALSIFRRNNLDYGFGVAHLTFPAGVESVELPGDFFGAVGLYNGNKLVQQKGAEEMETITSTIPFAVWAVDGTQAVVRNAPTSKTTLKLRYWQMPPRLKDVSDAMPWGGRWDDALCEYTRILLANYDEMTVSQDLQLLQDFENNLLTLASSRSPGTKEPRGWLS